MSSVQGSRRQKGDEGGERKEYVKNSMKKKKIAEAKKKLEAKATSIPDWQPASSFSVVSLYLRNMICSVMSLSPPQGAVLGKRLTR